MPTNRRRRLRPRRDKHEALVDEIEAGLPWEVGGGGSDKLQSLIDGHYRRFCGFKDAEEVRRYWSVLRDELLAAHVARFPGTRPAAWWTFDAPEPRRRRLGGQGIAAIDEPDAPQWIRDDGLWFGIPTIHFCLKYYDPPRYETEEQYLGRHDLLTQQEREVLQGPRPDYYDVVHGEITADELAEINALPRVEWPPRGSGTYANES